MLRKLGPVASTASRMKSAPQFFRGNLDLQLPLTVFCVCQNIPSPSGSVRSGNRKFRIQYGPNTDLRLLATSSSLYLCTPLLTSYVVCPRTIKCTYGTAKRRFSLFQSLLPPNHLKKTNPQHFSDNIFPIFPDN